MKKRLLTLICASAAASWAGSISITNPSFEDPVLPPGSIINSAPTGWTLANSVGGVWYPVTGAYFNSVPDQNQILFLGYGSPDEAWQTLSATLQANTTYTLTYYVGQRFDLNFSGYTVALMANGTVLSSDSLGAPTPGNFVQRTLSYSSGSSPAELGQALTIDIQATGVGSAGGGQAVFDLITLDDSNTSAAPEPATFGWMAAGITAIALGRRRQRILRSQL